MNSPSLSPSTFRRITFSTAALAGATLLLESALLRLLAVAQFYHFAFLVVSLALLGFGASGSMLSIWSRLTEMPLERLLTIAGFGFTLSVGAAYAVVNLLPFDSYSIAWERRQIFLFILYYLALTLPFLFTGLGIGAALSASSGRSHLVYGANLLGSGLGALLAPAALWLAGVPGAVLGSGMIGLLASFVSGKRTDRWLSGSAWLIAIASFALLTALNLGGHVPMGMTLSPYKGLSQARRYPGSSLLFSRWNAVSRVDVLAEAGTRQLPGLSYAFPENPPPQHGLSVDGEAPQPISLVKPENFTAWSHMPEAIAFELRKGGRVAVLDPGGGLGVLQALAGGGGQVVAVLDNPLVREAVRESAGELDIYSSPLVHTVLESRRVFLSRESASFDLVFLPLTDGFRSVTSGAFSLTETYGLTLEAFEAALDHLQPDGLLVVTRWLQSPPSEGLRLITTLIEALEKGSSDPKESLVAYRGIQTVTVLVQPDGWSSSDLRQLRAFLETRKFDLVWSPDIRPGDLNRFNKLPEPLLHETVDGLLNAEDRASFYARYPYDVTPPTDDHPFYFHFFTWDQTPDVLATLGRTWQPFGGSGYFVLLALLVLVVVLSLVLILAPLVLRSKSASSRPQLEAVSLSVSEFEVFIYFAFLGIAFLFVEIPLIQQWILLLGHPTYAFMTVVLTILLFSSVGSALARVPWLPKRLAMGVLFLLALATPFWVTLLTSGTLGLPFLLRSTIAVVSLAPLGVLMGLPFPFGLAYLERHAQHLIPWAWAVNGCASVVASVLAAIISLSYGFAAVLLVGAGAYAGAGTLFVIRFKVSKMKNAES